MSLGINSTSSIDYVLLLREHVNCRQLFVSFAEFSFRFMLQLLKCEEIYKSVVSR